MREIKFRAWNKEGNGYIRDLFYVGDGWYEMNNLVLEQYTGLCDKNGKEIYDGDIVRYPDDAFLCTIEWNEYELSWQAELVQYDGCGYRINLDTELEIVGNIHENPELLKGE
jgi:hypothetical protein